MANFVIGKEELAELYKTHSTAEIGRMHGVCEEAVRKRMVVLGVDRRPAGGRRKFEISREELDGLYQTMTLREIAAKFRVGQTVVFKRITEYGIKLDNHDVVAHRRHKGKTFSLAHRKALSLAKRGRWTGEKNPNWRDDASTKNRQARGSGEYKQWKNEVLERASFACQVCGVKQHHMCECCGTEIKLHVHHIQSFAKFPDLRFDVANGEVLCPKCHFTRHH